jgi:hypothetical protein
VAEAYFNAVLIRGGQQSHQLFVVWKGALSDFDTRDAVIMQFADLQVKFTRVGGRRHVEPDPGLIGSRGMGEARRRLEE